MKREFEPFFKWPKVRWPFANPHQWSLDDLLKDEAAAGRMLENLKEELQEIISRVEVLTIFVGFLLDNPGDLQRLAAWKKNRLRLRPAGKPGAGGAGLLPPEGGASRALLRVKIDARKRVSVLWMDKAFTPPKRVGALLWILADDDRSPGAASDGRIRFKSRAEVIRRYQAMTDRPANDHSISNVVSAARAFLKSAFNLHRSWIESSEKGLRLAIRSEHADGQGVGARDGP